MKTFDDRHKISLKLIAHWMRADLEGEDRSVSGVAIDSRTVSDNELFFALVGERVNGHDYIEEVARKNAAGIVASQKVTTAIPRLYVRDTRHALGLLGKNYREQFNMPMAAITGSYGKTTVKEMLASILAVESVGLATQGNLNTEIGVPLTLLQLKDSHQWAVIEMGARKQGDIGYLMDIAQPTVALINNAGVAHIEVFGSELAVRNAKGELFSHLSPEGIAVMNEMDPHISYWKSLLKGQTVFTFGESQQAQLKISSVHYAPQNSTFKLKHQNQEIEVTLFTPGEHNVKNALSAGATALAMGASLQAVKKGLEKFRPVSGRLQFIKGIREITMIDDTYNANPDSMRAALAVLAAQPGMRYFVMADMLELGDFKESWHRDIGFDAKRLGIHKMFGFGPITRHACSAFGENAQHYEDKNSLIHDLKKGLNKDVTILVKGSRGMHMEDVIKELAC